MRFIKIGEIWHYRIFTGETEAFVNWFHETSRETLKSKMQEDGFVHHPYTRPENKIEIRNGTFLLLLGEEECK